jgi:predicted transcriptional regulator
MSGTGRREGREAQAKVLIALLEAGDAGLAEADIEARTEDLSEDEVERAVDALLGAGLIRRLEARLYPSRPSIRFHRLRPL